MLTFVIQHYLAAKTYLDWGLDHLVLALAMKLAANWSLVRNPMGICLLCSVV